VRGQDRQKKSNKQCVVNLSKNEANAEFNGYKKKEREKIVGVKRKPEIFSMGKIIMSLLITPFISRNSPARSFPWYRIFVRKTINVKRETEIRKRQLRAASSS